MNVRDLQFNPKYTAEGYEAAKDFLLEKSFSLTANFAVILDDGTVVPFRSQGCHGAVNTMSNRGVTPDTKRMLIATENGASRRSDKVNLEVRDLFLDWFLNHPNWSRFILNREDRDFCRNHGFIFSADMDCRLLVNLLILTRHFYEISTGSFELFNKWSKIVPIDMAYSLAFNTYISIDSKNGLLYSYFGHRMTQLWSSMEEYENFTKGEYGDTLVDDTSRHFRNFATIYGGAAYCRDGKPKDSYESFVKHLLKDHKDLRDNLADFRGEKRDAVRIVNPFKIQVAQSTVFKQHPHILTVKETEEVLLPFLASYFKTEDSEEDNSTFVERIKETIFG